jgi:P-type conjugative transfer protein TrbG
MPTSGAARIFVILALTGLSAFAQNAGPPSPTGPGILAQSPVQGIIAPVAPSPTPSPTPTAAVASAAPIANPVSSSSLGPGPDSGAVITAPTPAASPTPGSSFQSDLLGGKEPILDDEERAGVEVTDAWRQKSYESMVSQAGTTGSVLFRYGASYPSIVCAILQVTDIELEPGEVVTQVNVGDTTRWSVESAVSGAGTSPMQAVQHLIVKPRDIGLSTSLVVTTDRRTYHLILVSDQTEFMHSVRFVYADQHESVAAATPAASPVAAPSPAPAPEVAHDPPARHQAGQGKQVAFVKGDPAPVDDTDDGYVVTGRADWKPVSVYSKDGKTYIEMPESVRHKEAPVLFEETKKGWFHHEKILVNYRVKGRWYVVDKVIDKGTLVSGVGTNQVKVDIRHVEVRGAPPATEGEK